MGDRKVGSSFEGILKGLTGLVDKLGELAEKGDQLQKSGEIKFKGGEKNLKGLYGFSFKVGLGGDDVKIEPFGNVRKDKESGEAVVQEIREPIADVFEEKDYTLIVVEMPGISEGDVHIDVSDDLLTLYAEKGEKKYRKEILMPSSYLKEKMQVSCNNGMLEIKCVD